MNKKVIYLAGGCYWGVEKYVSNIRGVSKTTVGFANGRTEAPTYEQVKNENTGHAETVRVEYDSDVLGLPALLALFYKVIDPTSVDRQGADEGHQYRTGVYFTEEKEEEIIMASMAKLEKEVGAPLAVEVCRLEQFWPAEEYHQKYLDKNPAGYCHVPLQLIQWVKTVDPAEYAKNELPQESKGKSCIFKRVSVRKYEDRPVEQEKIERMLRAAMAAPSACNQQPWEFYVVTDKDVIKELSESSPYSGCAKEAPVVFVPCYRKECLLPPFAHIDMSAAVENLLLEAVEQGLGAVWMGVAPRNERMEAVGKILSVPDELAVFAMVACGYPAEEREQQDRYEESRVHYI